MKKIWVICFCLAGMLFGYSGIASAYSQTNLLSTYLWGTGEYSWTHNTPSDFSVPDDIVNSARLKIRAGFVNGRNDLIYVDDILAGKLKNGMISYNVFDLAEVFVNWKADDVLTVTMKYIEGGPNEWFKGIFLYDSTFSLDYTNGIDSGTGSNDASATPEPCTLLLLGSGLTGFAFWGKRRKAA